MKSSFLLLPLVVGGVVISADSKLTGKDELERIWAGYQSKLAEALKLPRETYLKDLEKLERDAMRANDAIAAAAIRKERDSPDFGEIPLAIPPKKTTPQLTELRRVRTDFERKRDEAKKALLVWCRTALERAEKSFMQSNDPISAAALRIERDAVSRPLLRIVHASYGSGNRADITLPLRKAIRFNRLEVAAGNHLAGDPAPYQIKNTAVTFQLGTGKEVTIWLGESGVIKVP